jgi:hypothetical protein
MSPYFAIYRPYIRCVADQTDAGHSTEALTWDFPAQASGEDVVDQVALATPGTLHQSVAGLRPRPRPLRRWAAPRALGERG